MPSSQRDKSVKVQTLWRCGTVKSRDERRLCLAVLHLPTYIHKAIRNQAQYSQRLKFLYSTLVKAQGRRVVCVARCGLYPVLPYSDSQKKSDSHAESVASAAPAPRHSLPSAGHRPACSPATPAAQHISLFLGREIFSVLLAYWEKRERQARFLGPWGPTTHQRSRRSR